jgi:hypothetical protein
MVAFSLRIEYRSILGRFAVKYYPLSITTSRAGFARASGLK